jgi:hypothetical protein
MQRLNLKSSSDSDLVKPMSQVLLKLDSGEALLVAKSFGAGNVLQFAFSADTSDSNLPLRPIYVPLMQNIVQWLSSGVDSLGVDSLGVDSGRNTTTGQSLVIKSHAIAVDATKIDETKISGKRLAIVTLPDQSKVEKKFDLNGQLSFIETAFPGVYSVAIDKDASNANSGNIERYAVNAPVDESELQFLTPQKLNELATSTGASVAVDAQELLTMHNLRANGREAWRWFLLVLIALLFFELWWQQRIARGPL